MCVVMIVIMAGDSTQGGYSLYSGMDCDTGQLVTIYEWTVPCKASRKTDTRRIKQVRNDMVTFIELYLIRFLV